MKENIYLYFTSDVHSHFEHWPNIIEFFNEQIYRRKQRDDTYFLLDNGDHMDRFHPITEAFLGEANVSLLNDGGYDCVTVGNNEGITLPAENFFHLYDNADFSVVCANIYPKNEKKPSWLKPYTMLQSKKGVKIAVLGLTAPFQLFYEQIGWQTESPYDVLDRYIAEVKAQSDVIVLLSHLGIHDDEYIANHYPEIDIIIGGHTHHLFKHGEVVNDTLLAAVGKHGMYAGEIMFSWDFELNEIVTKEASAIDINHYAKDHHTESLLRNFDERANEILSKSVGFLKEHYEVNWFSSTALIEQLVETMKIWTEADCAMLNAGMLLGGLERGVITYGDLHRICPHPVNPCKVKVSGEELLEIIRLVKTKRFEQFELKGFGFRGKVIGKMIFSNITTEMFTDQHGDQHVKKVYINGEPLNKNRKYQLATADTFTFGQLIPEIAKSTNKEYYMPEFLRDLLGDTIKKFTS
ncbi:bifunctional metallophosphatase/5'-nucleotidase [Salirhabdus salicampi]|uniref:bifunctional metallophosphatase/5'-nucleotidase n=1 Tax=Salirhabdus salicampi TaxID=476102 RepID=UPI0020C3771A|nr:bifunctional UDP-sugar hydrolase/5'-nucleotidase [Salirhabdus salicampi]MCP8617741.1 bifunctional metallophosphatase/5'-nucleotidase [Salirhabdus salicampi]